MRNISIFSKKFLALILLTSNICIADDIDMDENILEETKHLQLTKKFEKLQSFHDIPRQTYGTPANLSKIKELSLKKFDELKEIQQRFIRNMNKAGLQILLGETDNNNWLIKEFMSQVKDFHKPILNINAGVGNWSIDALKAGAKVISHDDKDIDNLLSQVRNLDDKTYLNNFYLNVDIFPKKLNFPDESLSAVLIHRELNLLTGQEIEDGISKISKWLSSGDRIYLLALSPYNHNYNEFEAALYDQNWEEGKSWPGENVITEKAIPMYNQDNPKFIHVMDERPLKKLLDKIGFHIIKSDYVAANYENKGINVVDDKAMIGIIAEKY